MALKYSRQREIIKKFLEGRRDHPTADIVYMNVRKQLPHISLGTIYRNLTLLTDTGDIQRLRLGDGVDHFDADISPHYHFICQGCGCVQDLRLEETDGILDTARAHFGGRIEGHMTYFYGSCNQCSQNAKTKGI